jgi:prevent-host-death family protein
MKSLSISELKATFSEQIRTIRQGEGILVTDRGIPVARLLLIEPTAAGDPLVALERNSLIRRGEQPLQESFFSRPRPQDPAGSLRSVLAEEREA